ncbi:HEAT repeat domain-containing protein [Paenibacillus koleovorans]|uniref:HEAT repeat domain-containing protein n=1 Tax=Paenibacillus koleovorans TaxID=121608 RepID=UPI000FD9CFAB|nr:HEAT repeat domain-containing protein [Paenibacillus koleovorans]
MVAAIAESKLILFPKTIDYYQIELTRMLETERYQEAMQVLRFLLECRHDDDSVKQEWGSLLEWLETTFPESLSQSEIGARRQNGLDPDESRELLFGDLGDPDSEDEQELDFLKRKVRLKSAEDTQYGARLLEGLLQTDSPDKQLLALEQLQHADYARTRPKLAEWLQTSHVHPVVQFKALQVLRQLGEKSLLTMHKLGQTIDVRVEETPLSYEEFPPQVNAIRERVQEANEVNQPALAYFVEQTWNDFLAFIYGTSIYKEMLDMDADSLDIWSAALHHMLQETMFAKSDERETRDMFGIADKQVKAWQKACQVMKLFLTVTAPAEA